VEAGTYLRRAGCCRAFFRKRAKTRMKNRNPFAIRRLAARERDKLEFGVDFSL
jgi:hypothetical protein